MPALSDIQEHEDFSTVYDEEMDTNAPSKACIGRASMKDETAPVKFARCESCAVVAVRRFSILALILASLATTGLVFLYARRQEIEHFEQAFAYDASQMINTYSINAQQRLKSLESFSESITRYALSQQENDDDDVSTTSNSTVSSFPFVTMPEFERRAAYTLESAEVLGVIFHPIVQTDQRAAWQSYSVDNQAWLTESLQYQATQSGSPTEVVEKILADPIPSMITAINEETGFPMIEERPGPYAVLWQTAPALDNSLIINFDSYTIFQEEMDTVMTQKRPVMSTVLELGEESKADGRGRGTTFLLESFLAKAKSVKSVNLESGGGLTSVLNIPVFDTWTANRKVAGVLMVLVYWQRYLDNLVPELNESSLDSSMVAVISSTCDQTYTFELSGPIANLVGSGDLHDTSFDHLVRESGYDAITNSNSSDARPAECVYNLRIYPTKEMEKLYLTDEPYYFAGIIFLAFVFTALVFWCYDCFVKCQVSAINSKAVESTAVVSSLFPAAVRDQVVSIVENYNDEKNKDHRTSWKRSNKFPGAYSHGKFERLAAELDESKPVANLYKNCTVLFCDVAGFTQWSSRRSPSQVFKLLEAIYGAFDEIASKRKVFKVETIGDCYVAVTGLPQPQANHAVIMAKFANDCMVALQSMMHILVSKLGEDTANLSMRFGLHSGPVTAGVLRGQRARFQLFGDTVNTASRMESLGQKGRIQVSEATADLLIKAGKQHWVTPRGDKVEAKGKGLMQTYWVDVASNATITTVSSITTPSLSSPEYSPRKPAIPQTILTDSRHSAKSANKFPEKSSEAFLTDPSDSDSNTDDDDDEVKLSPLPASPGVYPRRRISWSTVNSSTFDPFELENDEMVKLSIQQHKEYKEILEKLRCEI